MYYFNENKTRPAALITVVSIVTDVTHHLKYVTALLLWPVLSQMYHSIRRSVCNNVFSMNTWPKWTLSVLESDYHEDSKTPPTCLIRLSFE